MNKKNLTVLFSPGVYATTAFVVAYDLFGGEMLDWTSETLRIELNALHKETVDPVIVDRIMAAIAIYTTDQFITDVKHFVPLCNVLAGSPMAFNTFEPADAYEIAWALVESQLIYPLDEDEKFSLDVIGYITERLKYEGFIRPPKAITSVLPIDLAIPGGELFTDDPVMYSATYAAQTAKTEDVDNAVNANMLALKIQLESLELATGKIMLTPAEKERK